MDSEGNIKDRVEKRAARTKARIEEIEREFRKSADQPEALHHELNALRSEYARLANKMERARKSRDTSGLCPVCWSERGITRRIGRSKHDGRPYCSECGTYFPEH